MSVESATDHTACKAAHEALYEAAVEAMENPGLMTPRQALDYRLGTAGHLYHREGWEECLRERNEYRQAALELNAEIRNAMAWMATGAEPSVAHNMLIKTADKWRELLEDGDD